MDDRKQDLDALEQRLDQLRDKVEPKAKGNVDIQQSVTLYTKGMTIAFSFVGGIVVGLIMGLGLDHLLGTRPWFLVIMTLFGVAAGIVTAVRMARELEASAPKPDPTAGLKPAWDDDEDD